MDEDQTPIAHEVYGQAHLVRNVLFRPFPEGRIKTFGLMLSLEKAGQPGQ